MPKSVLTLILLTLLLAACNLSREDATVAPSPTPAPPTPLPTTPPPPQTPGVTLPPGQTPFITITEPVPPAEGEPTEVNELGFTVAGQQFGSFENNVIVQALDNEGNVLDEAVTTATGGGMGELTFWEVFLEPGATPDDEGIIRAYFTSPKDGSVVAEATLPVVYGVGETG